MDHPTLGRIVHYRFRAGDTPRAAIVTSVNPDAPAIVDLTVFPPGNNPYPVARVPHGDDPGAPRGYWTWPPRA